MPMGCRMHDIFGYYSGLIRWEQEKKKKRWIQNLWFSKSKHTSHAHSHSLTRSLDCTLTKSILKFQNEEFKILIPHYASFDTTFIKLLVYWLTCQNVSVCVNIECWCLNSKFAYYFGAAFSFISMGFWMLVRFERIYLAFGHLLLFSVKLSIKFNISNLCVSLILWYISHGSPINTAWMGALADKVRYGLWPQSIQPWVCMQERESRTTINDWLDWQLCACDVMLH